LFGVGSNPGIPLGSSIDYWGASAPTSAFALAYGQAISRTTYASLFSLLGTTYGTGDGTTTFNLPDLRGRVIAGKDDMGGSAASRLTSTYFGTSAAALGAAGGSQSHTLTAGESAVLTYTSSFTVSPTQWAASTLVSNVRNDSGSTNNVWTGSINGNAINIASNGTISTTSNAGGNPHAIVQPTIIANILIRVI
jgi:microcystin-dependent protein